MIAYSSRHKKAADLKQERPLLLSPFMIGYRPR